MIDTIRTALRTPSITNLPPDAWEKWRNDLLVLAVVFVAFVLGFGVRNLALTASVRYRLGEDLPTLRYPAGWITGSTEEIDFQATNPASPSSFDAQLNVVLRPIRSTETLDLARAALGLERSRDLPFYRELAADLVTVLGDTPALRTHYAFVADTGGSGGGAGLPVVVRAQDLLWIQNSQLIIITAIADATEWDGEERHFDLVWRSLAVNDKAAPTPTATTESEQ